MEGDKQNIYINRELECEYFKYTEEYIYHLSQEWRKVTKQRLENLKKFVSEYPTVTGVNTIMELERAGI